jgi:hypothetical protein
MRLLPLILIILLGLELGLPYQSCQMGDSCHVEEVQANANTKADHGCCASKTAQNDEHEEEDCQEDCSCSCCRVLMNVYPTSSALPTITALSPARPNFQHGLHLLDFGSAIWEPPQLA